jgi:uncharacterized protein YggU (UPF0235/DUF167 family)
LVVHVTAPATGGRANKALVDALASALGLRRSSVQIIAGASARTKVVELADVDPVAIEGLLSQ